MGHPCEVLSDAFYIHCRFGDVRNVSIGLWGPVTNVIRSWHQLAQTLGMTIRHFCASQFHRVQDNVVFSDAPDACVDILLTDSLPSGYADQRWSLTAAHLAELGGPVLLPTPPFYIGEELGFDPVGYPEFAGYWQKSALLDVQRALLTYLLDGGR
jgi:ornithine carbamoyltransferase